MPKIEYIDERRSPMARKKSETKNAFITRTTTLKFLHSQYPNSTPEALKIMAEKRKKNLAEAIKE